MLVEVPMRRPYIALLLPLVLLAILFAGCDNDSARRQLQQAEAVLDSVPQQARTLLDSVDTGHLSRGDRALYALLMSKALDKTDIDLTSDSLISVATDYYDATSDIPHRFLSYYYQGRIYQNAGDLPRAMFMFTKAEQLADKIDDNYAKALLYANEGLLYNLMYDLPKSIDSYQKAYMLYCDANLPKKAYNTLSKLGNLYFRTRDYDKSIHCLQEAMDWAYNNKQSSICHNCFVLFSLLYIETKNTDSLIELYQSKYYDLCHDDILIDQTQAYIHAKSGNPNSAKAYLDHAWQQSKSQDDTIRLYYNTYLIERINHHPESALFSLEKLYLLQDSLLRIALQQPVVTVQRDYYQSQAELKEYKLRLSRQTTGIVVALALLLVAGILLTVRHSIRRKDERIAQLMSLAEEFQAMNGRHNEMSVHIRELFTGQYKLIDELSAVYYETKASHTDQTAIYQRVTNEINAFAHSKSRLAQLEAIVNKYRSNVMAIARSEMTQFTQRDFTLLCFLYAAFSAKAISTFTNDSINNIYTRKNRLLKEIRRASTPGMSVMLDMMP